MKEILDIPKLSDIQISASVKISKFKGSFLGLATGDALGLPLENKSPNTFEPIKDIVGVGILGLEPGKWTDDTSMALCLAESLIEKKGFEPIDQLERYLKWYREGYHSSTGFCFGMGRTTYLALRKFEHTRDAYCGTEDILFSGNGSIMRLTPVPMYFSNNFQKAIEMSGESSKTTHASPLCIDACYLLGSIIVGLLNGFTKEQVLSENYLKNYWSQNPLNEEIEKIRMGTYKKNNPPYIMGTGYAVKCLEAALWAFHKTTTFEEGCLSAANLGHDADTTAAVFGQIAGAYYGYEAIPKKWADKIFQHELIESYAEKLIV